MTPDTIRSLYAETLTRALESVTDSPCCDECSHEPMVSGYLSAGELVDALAADGLLPTKIERWCGADIVEFGSDKPVRRIPEQQRYVTEWAWVSE